MIGGIASNLSRDQVILRGADRTYTPISGTVTPYLGACYSPASDRVYYSPFYKNAIVEIDPSTGAQTEYTFNADDAWSGVNPVGAQYSYSIMADQEGNVIAIPYFSPTAIIFDTANKTFTFYNLGLGSGTGKYYHGCIANDGNAYWFPYAANRMYQFDPVNQTGQLFGDTVATTTHITGVYAEDNCVYQMPYPSPRTDIRKIDLSTGTASLLSSKLPNTLHAASCLLQDGRIIFLPSNTSFPITIFDPVTEGTETFSVTGLGSTLNFNLGCNLAPNGKVYNYKTDVMYEIDPIEKTVNVYDTSRYAPTLATQGGTYCEQGVFWMQWESSGNRIGNLWNIGKHEASMAQFPANIADISVSDWNKYNQSF